MAASNLARRSRGDSPLGDRVNVTLGPELMCFPNPVEGEVAEADGSGNFVLKSGQGIVRINAADVLSLTALNR